MCRESALFTGRNDPDAFYSHHGSRFSGVRPRLVQVRGKKALLTALQVLAKTQVRGKNRKRERSERSKRRLRGRDRRTTTTTRPFEADVPPTRPGRGDAWGGAGRERVGGHTLYP